MPGASLPALGCGKCVAAGSPPGARDIRPYRACRTWCRPRASRQSGTTAPRRGPRRSSSRCAHRRRRWCPESRARRNRPDASPTSWLPCCLTCRVCSELPAANSICTSHRPVRSPAGGFGGSGFHVGGVAERISWTRSATIFTSLGHHHVRGDRNAGLAERGSGRRLPPPPPSAMRGSVVPEDVGRLPRR